MVTESTNFTETGMISPVKSAEPLEMTSFEGESFRLIVLANPGAGVYSGKKFLKMMEPGEQREVSV